MAIPFDQMIQNTKRRSTNAKFQELIFQKLLQKISNLTTKGYNYDCFVRLIIQRYANVITSNPRTRNQYHFLLLALEVHIRGNLTTF